MRRPRRPAHQLRTAIDLMPEETREAMLHGIKINPIIVGAYTDREGGVCPMLAAHRNGGRTSFASFARAWDRYTRAGDTPRRATEREVSTLKSMLQASLAIDSVRGGSSFDEAITDHRDTQVRRALREEHEAAAGEPLPELPVSTLQPLSTQTRQGPSAEAPLATGPSAV